MRLPLSSRTAAWRGEQAVVLQDGSLAQAKGGGNSSTLGVVEHDALAGVERYVVVEGAQVLRDDVKVAAQRAERLAVDRVRVRHADSQTLTRSVMCPATPSPSQNWQRCGTPAPGGSSSTPGPRTRR